MREKTYQFVVEVAVAVAAAAARLKILNARAKEYKSSKKMLYTLYYGIISLTLAFNRFCFLLIFFAAFFHCCLIK